MGSPSESLALQRGLGGLYKIQITFNLSFVFTFIIIALFLWVKSTIFNLVPYF